MRFKLVPAFLILAALNGCVTKTPHNDVLIFGTGTKLGVDVSASVQNAGIPAFTVGYNRLEAVWMPLKPNGVMDENPSDNIQAVVENLISCQDDLEREGWDSQAASQACASAILPVDKYVSLSSGVDSSTGGEDVEIDTYSVFASFGGRGSLGVSSASGALAQFFATGIAAQRLGANPQVGLALNAGADEAAARQADAQKAEAEASYPATVQALVEAGATPEDAVLLAEGTDQARTRLQQDTNIAFGCVKAWSGTPPGSLSDPNAQTIATSFLADDARLRAELRRDDGARASIITACQ